MAQTLKTLNVLMGSIERPVCGCEWIGDIRPEAEVSAARNRKRNFCGRLAGHDRPETCARYAGFRSTPSINNVVTGNSWPYVRAMITHTRSVSLSQIVWYRGWRRCSRRRLRDHHPKRGRLLP
jgi:hypothetical protein